MAAAQRALCVDPVEAFGRGEAPLRRGAALYARAAVAAVAALEGHLSCLTSSGDPGRGAGPSRAAGAVPLAGPWNASFRLPWSSAAGHCISGAISWARAGRWRGAYRVGETQDATRHRGWVRWRRLEIGAWGLTLLRRRKIAQPTAGHYIRLYLGPLPPSRGVQRGPTTSVALQSTQLGGFTRSTGAACCAPTATSYTPAGHR